MEMDISKIDKNFKVETTLKETDICFYSVREEPFRVYGLLDEGGKFRRIPADVAASVNVGVNDRHANAAGGRVRFVTDSPYIAIKVKLEHITRMSHFTLCGSAGFDLYSKDEGGYVYRETFIPPYAMQDGYESIKYPAGGGVERAYQINLPLYTDVVEMYVGIKEGSTLRAAEGYLNSLPVVFLGSSITQGGCASRPGNSYEEMLSRRLNMDYINLGFSGSCRAEDEMMDYIASLKMSAFVYDYDYNTKSPEHLAETHEHGFLKIRAAHPELPIILMSAPAYKPLGVMAKRREIVKMTYDNAIARGDKNVYYIDGDTLMALCKDGGTVDNVHPNDLGFTSMAAALYEVMKDIKLK